MEKNKKKWILPIFIILLMITSIAGFITLPESTQEINQEKKYYGDNKKIRS